MLWTNSEETQDMWYDVMGEYPAYGYSVGADYPVYYVSWDDCHEFVEVMNVLDSYHTYRLPSKSELFKATEGGLVFCWPKQKGARCCP